MAGQIIFFEKNKADFTYESVSVTATESDEFAANILNRNNSTAWITTGSVDANETTLVIDMADTKDISEIILIKHNFKSFEVKYWDGTDYQNFSPAINETTNSDETNYYVVESVNTSRIQIVIHGTMVTDSDKFLYQFIATEKLGQLAGWPIIKDPKLSRNRKKNLMLSGKQTIFENVGSFSCTLKFNNFSSDQDFTLIENLYDQSEGFLVWLCGGDETQFKSIRQGYRMQDLYLMKCSDEYTPEYNKGLYKGTISLDIKLEEVVE